MKRIFTVITVISAVAMMASSAYGQAAGPQRQGGQRGQNPEFAKKMSEAQKKVMKQIGLTADQIKKVEAADKKNREKMQKMMQDAMAARQNGGEIDREKMRTDREKLQKEYQAELVKAMGKEKHAQYEKLMQAEMRKIREELGMGQGRGQGGNGGGQGRRGGGSTGGGF